MTKASPRQKTFEEKLRKFKTVFNAMAKQHYTVRQDFVEAVSQTVNKRSISAEAKVRRLKKILSDYPEKNKNNRPKMGGHFPKAPTFKCMLEKYVAPMLRVL